MPATLRTLSPDVAHVPYVKRRHRNANFNDRVRTLIDHYFPIQLKNGTYVGNVSEASRHLGMSQRGLAKLYRGDVRDPRLSSLRALVEGLPREDPQWIVFGMSGPPTRDYVSHQIAKRALALVEAAAGEQEESPYADGGPIKPSSKRRRSSGHLQQRELSF